MDRLAAQQLQSLLRLQPFRFGSSSLAALSLSLPWSLAQPSLCVCCVCVCVNGPSAMSVSSHRTQLVSSHFVTANVIQLLIVSTLLIILITTQLLPCVDAGSGKFTFIALTDSLTQCLLLHHLWCITDTSYTTMLSLLSHKHCRLD